jgi:branched-chain amino acid transport system substrate-binding protein
MQARRGMVRFWFWSMDMKHTAALKVAIGLLIGLFSNASLADEKSSLAAADREIRIGNMMPYSGPASALSIIGKTQAAYFNKVNADGGIGGRKIRFITYDDAYNPAKTVEQARRLVEDDQVLLIFGSIGTATNGAIQKYMNDRQVPLLFVVSGAARFNDPAGSPWVMPILPSFEGEGRIYAKYLLQARSSGKIAILYQNDDYGREIVKGFKDALGDKLPVVAEKSYNVVDTTVDSQIVSLKASGADILLNVSTPKFAAQSIRRVAEIDWKPLHLLNNLSSTIGSVLKPAGLENSTGIISAGFIKDQTDESLRDDAGYREWAAFMDTYYPDGDRANGQTVSGYVFSQILVHVLKLCGDDLSRENVIKHAAAIRDLQLGMLLPGIAINTSPDVYTPLNQMRMRRFTGKNWESFGPVMSGADRDPRPGVDR